MAPFFLQLSRRVDERVISVMNHAHSIAERFSLWNWNISILLLCSEARSAVITAWISAVFVILLTYYDTHFDVLILQ